MILSAVLVGGGVLLIIWSATNNGPSRRKNWTIGLGIAAVGLAFPVSPLPTYVAWFGGFAAVFLLARLLLHNVLDKKERLAATALFLVCAVGAIFLYLTWLAAKA